MPQRKAVICSLMCLLFCAFGSDARAQSMYESDTLGAFDVRYSPNGQYRVRYDCPSTCFFIQEEWNGSSYQWRGRLFNATGSGTDRLEMYYGNLIWYTYTNQINEWSFTYSSNGTNWLNIQDDGNVVIYDSGNQALWTPACEWPNTPYYQYAFPPPPSCPAH